MKSFLSRFSPLFVLLAVFATALFAQNVLNYREQGGASDVIGGTMTISGTATVSSGGAFTAASGSTTNIAGTFQVGGVAVTSTAAELNIVDGVTATAAELNETPVHLDIADGSADATYYVVSPHAGTISKIYTVIDGSVATADITVTANIGVTPVTNGVVTIATAASAAGDVDSATPTAANTVTAGQAINFVVAGGGAGGSPRVHLVALITR